MKLQKSKVRRSLPVLAALTASMAFGGCGDEVSDPSSATGSVRLRVSANVLVSTTTLIIEVAAADIPTPLAFDLPIEHRVASGSITVPAGSNRTFTLRAYDLNDIETHRGFLTVDIHEGTTPIIISITLDPLASGGSESITVSIGTLVLSITPSFTTLAVGDVVQLTATLTDADGNTVDGKVRWGTLDATKATVDKKGRVTAVGVGQVQIAAVANFVAALAGLEILTLEDLVERLIGGAAATWWDALHNNQSVVNAGWPAILTTMADESSMSWGNFGIRDMSSEPRIAWPNTPTYANENTLRYPYENLYVALSAVRDGIIPINEGLVFDDAARTQRAMAFAKLIQGLSHGYLAMFWDQAAILNEDSDLSQVLPFVTHQEMMTEAIANLNASIAISDANAFSTPTTWFNGITLTNTQLSRLAHSFIARFIANNARTAAERDAVDWNAVKTHIAAGITEEFAPVGDQTGPFGGGPWFDLVKWMQGGESWSRADYRVIGGVMPNDPETDPDGGYATWLNLPVNDRVEYHLNTADKRVQAVAGVDACVDPNDCGNISPGAIDPGTDFRYAAGSPFPVNRGTYHFSFYKPTRYDGHTANGGGPMVHMTPTEMDLLLAEAHLRLSEGGAAALINLTRVGRGGLSAATDGDADIFEKLYYEKLIEQYNLASGLAFTERRGAPEIVVSSSVSGLTLFGLVPQTPRHFPVPARVLEALGLPLYTFGGSGPDMAPAAAGVRRGAPAAAFYKFNPGWTLAEKLEYLSEMRKGSGLTSYR